VTIRVIHGDSRAELRNLPDASADACVCDAPYELGFMGKAWDKSGVAYDVDLWREVLRILKPGGHLAAFGGTRTYHRMAVAIEDAGFEIRDQLGWTYGSGFPKSHDVAKGIAKRRTEDIEPTRAVCRFIRDAMDAESLKSRDLTHLFDDCNPRLIDHWAARDTDSQPSLPTLPQWEVLVDALKLVKRGGFDLVAKEVVRLNGRKGERGAAWTAAEIVGEVNGVPAGFGDQRFTVRDNMIRSLEGESAEWQGWGTALKPAWEPICLARKPLVGTVAQNVLAYGTGALNIDGCRIHGEDAQGGTYEVKRRKPGSTMNRTGGNWRPEADGEIYRGNMQPGRWPANLIHDGSVEVVALFPSQAGAFAPIRGTEPSQAANGEVAYGARERVSAHHHGDSVSAARFFYTAKADKLDRLGSDHPTVKPVNLMRWLVRLLTPPGGTILDPFAGTGPVGIAAIAENFDAILIELRAEAVADINRRLAHVRGEGRLTALETARLTTDDKARRARGADTPLFSGIDE
jgi:DNA modification methylase